MKFCSVILCHYGQINPGSSESRSEMLKETIETVRSSDYPMELIVLDNGGSPDDSDYLLECVRKGIITTYVRFHDNMSFGYAWNTGVRIATGDYIAFICNDLSFKTGWLKACIDLLEKYPERKFIATPYITPDKDRQNFNKEVLPDGSRVNSLAGSNCMVLTHDIFADIGEFPHHRIGGSAWHRWMHNRGYLVIVPKDNYVIHRGYRKGVQWKKPIKVEKTLVHGEKINFHYVSYQKSMYHGSQRVPFSSFVKGSKTERVVFNRD